MIFSCDSARVSDGILVKYRGEGEDTLVIKLAGVRASEYGIRPFPGPEEWVKFVDTVRTTFPGALPCIIWILGIMEGERDCKLSFPGDGRVYPHIVFEAEDKNEIYLDYFDRRGVKVFLQVEPGDAEVVDLIRLVLERYSEYECVIGFGVDVEWYREADYDGWGMPVGDSTAKSWEEVVKSFNEDYRLFLKHWDSRWMPPKYRGDIVFVNDSQMLNGLSSMVEEFSVWAKTFYPNFVAFQVGYSSDEWWWDDFTNPVETIGKAIADSISVSQKCGIFWVDFTLREVFPGIE